MASAFSVCVCVSVERENAVASAFSVCVCVSVERENTVASAFSMGELYICVRSSVWVGACECMGGCVRVYVCMYVCK